MFVIMVYDISDSSKAGNKVLKISRRYLQWVQNSVFEGEITDAGLFKLKHEIKSLIDDTADSVIFYIFRSKEYYKREIMGKDKGGDEQFL